jgi:hypothetical protein
MFNSQAVISLMLFNDAQINKVLLFTSDTSDVNIQTNGEFGKEGTKTSSQIKTFSNRFNIISYSTCIKMC